MSGHRAFTEQLARVAAAAGSGPATDGRLAAIVEGLRAPLSVGVFGRPGVGCRTVAQAVRAANPSGISCGVGGAADPGIADSDVPDSDVPDLYLYVFTETLKPEDRNFFAGSSRPCVAVLNKADLTGFGGDGPMSAAAVRCGRVGRETGIPTYPVASLLAVAAHDERVVDAATIDAFRLLAVDPADLGSIGAFLERPHRLPAKVRGRLLEHLGLFGIALVTSAVRGGADTDGVRRLLRRTSGISGLLAAIEQESAAARYRRIQAALPPLTELSAGSAGRGIAELLAADEIVLARQAAAMDVMASAGMAGSDITGPQTLEAHLRRAVFWRNYAEGPVSELHRACATDIARAALRVWSGGGIRP